MFWLLLACAFHLVLLVNILLEEFAFNVHPIV